MSQKWIGFIFCVVLGTILTLILIVESKRPIHVHITADEIAEGLCNDETESND